MVKNVLKVLSSLILLGNLGLNIHAHNEQKSFDAVSDENSVNIDSDHNETLLNNYKFEKKWIAVVNEIIDSSNNGNKLDVKDSNKNTYKNTLCYNYSLENSQLPAIGGGGTIYYDGGYFSFNEFKTEVFKSILRQFISNRAKYLCGMSNNSLEEREELKEIIDVLTDNNLESIVSRCVNVNKLELTLF